MRPVQVFLRKSIPSTQSGQPVAYKRNAILDGILLVNRCLPDTECWLGSFLIVQGVVGTPVPPPPLDPDMHVSVFAIGTKVPRVGIFDYIKIYN